MNKTKCNFLSKCYSRFLQYSPLKRCLLYGTGFVFILGTLAHFFYQWSGDNFFVGLFTPVNESTWEHMKLVFFPMLLSSFVIIPKLQQQYPCIASSYWLGTLAGTLLVPVIYYTYTGILGRHLMPLDIATFFIAVIGGFFVTYRATSSCKAEKFYIPLCVTMWVMAVGFVLFTFCTPEIGLFSSP